MTATNALRATAALGAGAMAAALLVSVPTPADAARACKIEVTTRLDQTVRFEGGGIVKNYYATAQGSAVGMSNHSGNVVMTTFPQGSYPSLIHRKIGEREAVGSMTKSQAPTALGSINGDFFTFADIRYATDIEMARGPMVSGGKIIRGSAKQLRAVGLDSTKMPFGGTLAVRGSAKARVDGCAEAHAQVGQLAQPAGRGRQPLHDQLEQREASRRQGCLPASGRRSGVGAQLAEQDHLDPYLDAQRGIPGGTRCPGQQGAGLRR